jgi:hypothetical protein
MHLIYLLLFQTLPIVYFANKKRIPSLHSSRNHCMPTSVVEDHNTHWSLPQNEGRGKNMNTHYAFSALVAIHLMHTCS